MTKQEKPPTAQATPEQMQLVTINQLYVLIKQRCDICLNPTAQPSDFEALSTTLAQFNRAVQDTRQPLKEQNEQKDTKKARTGKA